MEGYVSVSLLCSITVGSELSAIDFWKPEDRFSGNFLLAACIKKRCLIWSSANNQENDNKHLCTWNLLAEFSQPKKTLDKNEATNGNNFIQSCKFSPDGEYIVTCGNDSVARVWSIESKSLHVELAGHSSFVSHCAFSLGSKNIVYTCSGDGKVLVFNWRTGCCFQGSSLSHRTSVIGIHILKKTNKEEYENDQVVTACSDGVIHFWDLPNTFSQNETLNMIKRPIKIGSILGAVHSQNRSDNERNRRIIRTDNAHTKEITCVSLGCNGAVMATASTDKHVKIWDTISLINDYESTINEEYHLQRAIFRKEETADSSYIAYSDCCAEDELSYTMTVNYQDCESEFRNVLTDYQKTYEKSREQQIQDHFSTSGIAQWKENRQYDLPISSPINSHVLLSLRHSDECLSCTIPNATEGEDDDLLFTSAKDCTSRIWCLRSGRLLYSLKTPDPISSMIVHSITEDETEKIKYHILLGVCGPNILVFKFSSLKEFQALIEYTETATNMNCEEFWSTHKNSKLFERAIELARRVAQQETENFGICSRDSKPCAKELESERRLLAKLVNGFKSDKSEHVKEVISTKILHCGPPQEFLDTLLLRQVPGKPKGLHIDLIKNMISTGLSAYDICKTMVIVPFYHMEVLEVVAMPPQSMAVRGINVKEFYTLMKRGSSSITPFLIKLGYQKLPHLNEHGGDPQLGMIHLSDSEREDVIFFCKDGSQQNESCTDYVNLIKFEKSGGTIQRGPKDKKSIIQPKEGERINDEIVPNMLLENCILVDSLLPVDTDKNDMIESSKIRIEDRCILVSSPTKENSKEEVLFKVQSFQSLSKIEGGEEAQEIKMSSGFYDLYLKKGQSKNVRLGSPYSAARIASGNQPSSKNLPSISIRNKQNDYENKELSIELDHPGTLRKPSRPALSSEKCGQNRFLGHIRGSKIKVALKK